MGKKPFLSDHDAIGPPEYGVEVAMKSKRWQRWAAMLLLVGYSLDLALKLADWRDSFGGVPWWGVAGGLIVRFAVMGFILSVYLRLKKGTQETEGVTRATKDASVRNMRIVHLILSLAIVGYAFLGERLARPAANPPASLVNSFWVEAAVLVVIAIGFRRRLLPSATEMLGPDSADTTVLGRWRMANILSMTLALAVSLLGLTLRILGGGRRAAWPLFITSALLMFLWRPRLGDPASGSDMSAPPPN